MAQPHLGDRVQIRYLAPKVLVDTLTAYAAARGLNLSQVTADLLAEITGMPELVRAKQPLDLELRVRTVPVPEPEPGSVAPFKFRVRSEVADQLDKMAQPGEKRPAVVNRLLAEKLGYLLVLDSGEVGVEQLALTG